MNLIVVCIVAFLTVMLLLSTLAIVIRLLSTVFPEPLPAESPSIDATTTAAIDAAVNHHIPGARLLRIEPDQRS